MKNLVLLISLICVLNFCTKNSITRINCQKNNSERFSFEIIRSIPLETSNNSIIGYITQVVFAEDRFFLFDRYSTNTITCFSDSSNFLFRIKSGRGPGELISPIDFAIVNRELTIIDQNKLKKYDHKGKFISEKVLNNGLYFYKFSFDQDSNYLVFGNSPSLKKLEERKSDPSIKLENILTQYKLIDKSLTKEIETYFHLPIELKSITCNKPMDRFGDHLLCLSPPSNIIYEYKNQKMTRKYVIDFGRYGFTKDDIKKGEKYLVEKLRSHKKYGFLDNINETSKYISFSYVKDPGHNTFSIFSKKTGLTADFSDIFNTVGLSQAEPLATINDDFICIFYPSRIPQENLVKINKILDIKKSLNESSNPIILQVRINEK